MGEDAEIIGYVEIDVDAPGDVAYRVNGHSMEPDIPSGAVVIVRRDVFSYGDVVVAFVDDVGYVIKRLIATTKRQEGIFRSVNPNYADLIAENAKIIGKVVELRRPFP